jgi:3D (Asp-Asp-Asp) domain-containing protein
MSLHPRFAALAGGASLTLALVCSGSTLAAPASPATVPVGVVGTVTGHGSAHPWRHGRRHQAAPRQAAADSPSPSSGGDAAQSGDLDSSAADGNVGQTGDTEQSGKADSPASGGDAATAGSPPGPSAAGHAAHAGGARSPASGSGASLPGGSGSPAPGSRAAGSAAGGALHVGDKIGGSTVVRVLHMTATAYGPSLQDNYPYGPVDAFGKPLVPGDVAVDPSVIPLNTHLYVTGYRSPYLPKGGEMAVARDTGGAIKGHRIDIFIDGNPQQVSSFGIQGVTVYVLK